ncbi:MAG TPA: DUF192 domain-containing protein [Candidatus Limnocylindria bacterium]
MILLRLSCAVALAIVACAPPGPPAPPYLAIDSAEATRFVRVEIAETDATRERGLMGRTTLDEDAGMLFIWSEDSSSAFWMKDTPLRLTVAFISADGRILRTLDMEPCTADPCPVYDPRETYRMALEVRQGALDRTGVRVGDRVRLVR